MHAGEWPRWTLRREAGEAVTPAELTDSCRDAIARLGPGAHVTLVIPGRMGNGPLPRKRAWKGGPMGECVSETMRGGKACVVMHVRASEVLAKLEGKR